MFPDEGERLSEAALKNFQEVSGGRSLFTGDFVGVILLTIRLGSNKSASEAGRSTISRGSRHSSASERLFDPVFSLGFSFIS